MARLEVQLISGLLVQDTRHCIITLGDRMGVTCNWIDSRNASLAIHVEALTFPVQVLIELKSRGQLGVLATSSEAGSRGAPLSLIVFEQVISHLSRLIPGMEVFYRSDRDGPVPRAIGVSGAASSAWT